MIAAMLQNGSVLFVTSSEPKEVVVYQPEVNGGSFSVDPELIAAIKSEGGSVQGVKEAVAIAFLRQSIPTLAKQWGSAAPGAEADGDALVRWMVLTFS